MHPNKNGGRCDGVLVPGGGGQQRRHFGGRWSGGRWSGNVDKVVRWRDSSGACPIELDPRGRAVVVHEVPCYPSSPARDWNAWVRNLTTSITPKPPKHRLRPMAGRGPPMERVIASVRETVELHKPLTGVSLVAGGGVGNQRAAQVGLEGTPHGHRDSGPWSLRRRLESLTGPGRPYRPGGIRSIGAPLCAQSGQADWGWLDGGKGYEGHGQGHVVHDHGKDDEMAIVTDDGGCTLSHNTEWKNKIRTQYARGGTNHFNQYPFREYLIKAGSGDWANLSGGCDKTADVGSTTLSKSFLKGTASVDRTRVLAPQLDGLRTAHRLDIWSNRPVGIYGFYLDQFADDAIIGSSRTGQCAHRVENLIELSPPAW